MIQAVVVDPEGKPWTPERFVEEPECAETFLEIYETNAFPYQSFEGLTRDEAVDEACYRLIQMQKDLTEAVFLRAKDKIH